MGASCASTALLRAGAQRSVSCSDLPALPGASPGHRPSLKPQHPAPHSLSGKLRGRYVRAGTGGAGIGSRRPAGLGMGAEPLDS